jgi:rSAM/selenodomain-associated transferase 2
MTFSIIIPTLNEAHNMGKLIPFLKQNADHRLLEIIVVDAQSVDNTEGAARAENVVVLQSQKRSRAVQMNLGAQVAKGDILYFIHADCTPPTSFLDDIEHVFTEGYALGCYRYRFDNQRFILKINSFFTRFTPLWCRGGDETLFVSKAVFEQLEGYDERFKIMEEYDFIRRAKTLFPFKIIPKYALVSARKYEKNAWLRVQIANFTAFTLFRLGVDSEKIAKTYRFMLT